LLRVLSLNLHKGFSVFRRRFVLHEMRAAIRETSSDIVFLQEVLGEHTAFMRRYPEWPAQTQYEFLADSIWDSHAYGRNAAYPEGHHGNALLSKYPIAASVNEDITIHGTEPRGVLRAVLDTPWPKLHIACVHLGLSEGQRRAQVSKLRMLIESTVPAEAPLIIAGDFNDWRGRANAPLAEIGLREAFLEYTGRTARTYPARYPLLSLDRIYFRGLDLVEAERLVGRPWSHLSDHAAIAATFARPKSS
jgi:endonuclease/exonuclease/phosphatase family metal-dependent hydrolase